MRPPLSNLHAVVRDFFSHLARYEETQYPYWVCFTPATYSVEDLVYLQYMINNIPSLDVRSALTLLYIHEYCECPISLRGIANIFQLEPEEFTRKQLYYIWHFSNVFLYMSSPRCYNDTLSELVCQISAETSLRPQISLKQAYYVLELSSFPRAAPDRSLTAASGGSSSCSSGAGGLGFRFHEPTVRPKSTLLGQTDVSMDDFLPTVAANDTVEARQLDSLCFDLPKLPDIPVAVKAQSPRRLASHSNRGLSTQANACRPASAAADGPQRSSRNNKSRGTRSAVGAGRKRQAAAMEANK